MAVDATRPQPTAERFGSPARALLFLCTAALCASGIGLIGWLIAAALPNALPQLHPADGIGVIGPLGATIYVITFALPLTVLVGGLAGAGIAEVRLFGGKTPALRAAFDFIGSLPTIVVAFAVLVAAIALGLRPSLNLGACAVALANLPLMATLTAGILADASRESADAATALGASPSFIIWRVGFVRGNRRLWAAVVSIATQMTGAAAAVILLASAHASILGATPLGAWPLAVQIWTRATDAAAYSSTAACTIVLIVCVWLLQEPLRSGVASGAAEANR
jgi:ABC-type phosphate transport system permease subunit